MSSVFRGEGGFKFEFGKRRSKSPSEASGQTKAEQSLPAEEILEREIEKVHSDVARLLLKRVGS
jgi:hypothetical protein